MRKRFTLAAAVVFLAILFAWQGGQSAEKAAKEGAQKGAPQAASKPAASSATASAAKAFEKVSQELYPKAKQEGNLIIYSVWDVEHLRVITEAFMKRYPGIKATYWQGRNPEIVTRVLTEFQGGQSSVDSILSDNAPAVLRAAGALASYETVQKDVLVLHDPTIPTVSLQVQALTYNTRKMKPADLPKSWEDVANPKYKGMVALDDPMRAGPLSSMLAGLK
ncbi:MAG TPA: extracellular solute-binding protein, partial [Candidatus Binatia bacterium]|nr:extracellular solute-binding protein [Candidatus Binatia bacterium]